MKTATLLTAAAVLLGGCYLSHEPPFGAGDALETAEPGSPGLVRVEAVPGTDDAVWCRPEALLAADGIGAGLGRLGDVDCEPVPLGLDARPVTACYRLTWDRPVASLRITARPSLAACGAEASTDGARALEVYRGDRFETALVGSRTGAWATWTVEPGDPAGIWHLCRPGTDPTAVHFEIDAVRGLP